MSILLALLQKMRLERTVGGLRMTRADCLAVVGVRTPSHQVHRLGREPVSCEVRTSLSNWRAQYPGKVLVRPETKR
jgi:hypothetical protein